MPLSDDQKAEAEILKAQGESDERIAAYLGVPVEAPKSSKK